MLESAPQLGATESKACCPSNAIDYAKHSSRAHDAVIRVYDAARNVIETHEHKGEFKRVVSAMFLAVSEGSGALKYWTSISNETTDTTDR